MTTLALENRRLETSLKKDRLIYWIATGLIAFIWVFSTAIMFTPDKIAGMVRLGFPAYFRYELIVAKVLGLGALLVPQVPARVREWAYAGYGIVLVSASLAHLNAGDPLVNVLEPLLFLVILAVSNVYLHKTREV